MWYSFSSHVDVSSRGARRLLVIGRDQVSRILPDNAIEREAQLGLTDHSEMVRAVFPAARILDWSLMGGLANQLPPWGLRVRLRIDTPYFDPANLLSVPPYTPAEAEPPSIRQRLRLMGTLQIRVPGARQVWRVDLAEVYLAGLNVQYAPDGCEVRQIDLIARLPADAPHA